MKYRSGHGENQRLFWRYELDPSPGMAWPPIPTRPESIPSFEMQCAPTRQ